MDFSTESDVDVLSSIEVSSVFSKIVLSAMSVTPSSGAGRFSKSGGNVKLRMADFLPFVVVFGNFSS